MNNTVRVQVFPITEGKYNENIFREDAEKPFHVSAPAPLPPPSLLTISRAIHPPSISVQTISYQGSLFFQASVLFLFLLTYFMPARLVDLWSLRLAWCKYLIAEFAWCPLPVCSFELNVSATQSALTIVLHYSPPKDQELAKDKIRVSVLTVVLYSNPYSATWHV